MNVTKKSNQNLINNLYLTENPINDLNNREIYYLNKNGYSIFELSIMFKTTENIILNCIENYENKIKYLDNKYGKGKWEVLDKAQLLELYKQEL